MDDRPVPRPPRRRRATRPADGGTPLPGSSSDDTDVGWGGRADEPDTGDALLREDRPPHHDQGW